MTIKNSVIDRKAGNPSVNNLSTDGWKNIVKIANKWQVGNVLILLLQILL